MNAKFGGRPSALLLILLAAVPALPQPAVQQGDLVLSGTRGDGFFIPSGISDLTVLDSEGSTKLYKRTALSSGAGELLFDPKNGNVYMVRDVADGSAGGWLTTYSSGLEQIALREAVGIPLDLTMDEDGTIWLIGSGGRLSSIAEGGLPPAEQQVTVSASHNLSSGDLGVDQCTLHYIETPRNHPRVPRLRRHDICRNLPLPDGPAHDFAPCERPKVRVARDGSLFLASCSAVYHLTDSGVRTYALPLGHKSEAFALSADGQSFWSAGLGKLFQIDLLSGSVLRGPVQIPSGALGLVVYGVPRAAVQAGLAAIPMNSFTGLVLFGLVLVALAFIRL